MAHSNRQKLRDARGGKTKHQDNKSKRYGSRSTFNAADRIKELESWQRGIQEARQVGNKVAVSEMRKRINMWTSTVRRRIGALGRLETTLKVMVDAAHDLTGDVKANFLQAAGAPRMEREMKTLKQRI